MTIRVQEADFDISEELKNLRKGRNDIGAIVSFTGLVRDMAMGEKISDLELEHYPGMTEKALQKIEDAAHERWQLQGSVIVHRYGKLAPGAQIVLVITASPHRKDAFAAAEFIMDFLKSRAPFWKKEGVSKGGRWVDARESDEAALKRW